MESCKKIIINTDKHCAFLRTEAVSKAIEYEDVYMTHRNAGNKNPICWIKEGTKTTYIFNIYHTKTSIIVDVKMMQISK